MIRIITDSTCEASPEVLRHPAVTVIPLTVVFGEEALRDGVDITREQFWARLPSSSPLPSTSQAVPSDFDGLFERFTAAGDEVVAVLLSSKLSGTISSALIAYESKPGWPVEIVDSKTTSVGLGLLVQEAVAMVDRGATRAEIVHRMEELRQRVRVVFVLETLEYLQRGGRIGKAQAFVGTILQFKPLLGIVDGEVVPLARVRSRTKALEAAQDDLLRAISGRGSDVAVAVTQALAADEADEFGRRLAASFGTQSFYMVDLGPVLGVHVGPGTVGVAVVDRG